MWAKIKKHAGLIYIATMTAVVAAVLVCTDELDEIGKLLGTLRLRWVCAAVGCVAAYLFLRMLTMRYYLCRHDHRISWRDALAVTGAGQLYSAITPSASGGQPMQVLMLHRRGVPASLGTACISAKFIGFQGAFLILGLILWGINRRLVAEQLYGFRWLVAVGYAVNAGLLLAVAMTIRRNRLVEKLCRGAVGVGARLRLVRHPEAVNEKLNTALAEYRSALQSLLRRPVDALVVFGLSVLQVVAYMSVIVCLYGAFGLRGARADQLLTIQVLLFVAAAFVPLPGAAGAQESGFCVFFRGLFPPETVVTAMVCWRFFTYYLLIVAGLVMMALGGVRKRKE